MLKFEITTRKIKSVIGPIGFSLFACAFASPVFCAPANVTTAARSVVPTVTFTSRSLPLAGERYAYEDPYSQEREQELRADQQQDRQELKQLKREKKQQSKMKKRAKRERKEEKAEEREERAEHVY